MKRVVVRYKLKFDRVTEHEALLQRVFAQLEENRVTGIRYEVHKLVDGVSFMHIATVTAPENPLFGLTAFKEFSADIKSRCEEQAVSSETTLVHSYGQ